MIFNSFKPRLALTRVKQNIAIPQNNIIQQQQAILDSVVETYLTDKAFYEKLANFASTNNRYADFDADWGNYYSELQTVYSSIGALIASGNVTVTGGGGDGKGGGGGGGFPTLTVVNQIPVMPTFNFPAKPANKFYWPATHTEVRIVEENNQKKVRVKGYVEYLIDEFNYSGASTWEEFMQLPTTDSYYLNDYFDLGTVSEVEFVDMSDPNNPVVLAGPNTWSLNNGTVGSYWRTNTLESIGAFKYPLFYTEFLTPSGSSSGTAIGSATNIVVKINGVIVSTKIDTVSIIAEFQRYVLQLTVNNDIQILNLVKQTYNTAKITGNFSPVKFNKIWEKYKTWIDQKEAAVNNYIAQGKIQIVDPLTNNGFPYKVPSYFTDWSSISLPSSWTPLQNLPILFWPTNPGIYFQIVYKEVFENGWSYDAAVLEIYNGNTLQTAIGSTQIGPGGPDEAVWSSFNKSPYLLAELVLGNIGGDVSIWNFAEQIPQQIGRANIGWGGVNGVAFQFFGRTLGTSRVPVFYRYSPGVADSRKNLGYATNYSVFKNWTQISPTPSKLLAHYNSNILSSNNPPTWETKTVPGGNGLNWVRFLSTAPNTFIAIANEKTVAPFAFSGDFGHNWEIRNLGMTVGQLYNHNPQNAAANWNNADDWDGKFTSPVYTGTQAMVWTNGVVAISIDGGWDWVIHPTTGTYSKETICYSPELEMFVAFNRQNKIFSKSTDGINWTQTTSLTDVGLTSYYPSSTAWSPELKMFVMVANYTSTILTSIDGINWTARNIIDPIYYPWNPTYPSYVGYCWNVIWSSLLGRFIMTNSSSEAIFLTAWSSDGINWNKTNAPADISSNSLQKTFSRVTSTNTINPGEFVGYRTSFVELEEFKFLAIRNFDDYYSSSNLPGPDKKNDSTVVSVDGSQSWQYRQNIDGFNASLPVGLIANYLSGTDLNNLIAGTVCIGGGMTTNTTTNIISRYAHPENVSFNSV
jgi:hypothetical protein